MGHLYLTVTNNVYNTLSDIPFIEQTNPGMLPEIPTGALVQQANDIQRTYTKATEFSTNTQPPISAQTVIIKHRK